MAKAYISASIPTLEVKASGTTLFHIAAQYLGDATLWYVLAGINGPNTGPPMDPWISAEVTLNIPSPEGLVSNGGILGQ